MIERLFRNHVFANLTMILVLVQGAVAYIHMPREQDPEVNFNWISVTTRWPGASAEDVEKLVTDQLEEALEKVPDVKFVSSYSREGFSDILVRFGDIEEKTLDKRVTDLRREIQTKADKMLPEDVDTPFIMEITSASAFPSALLVVVGNAYDEVLRRYASNLRQDLERMSGVERVDPTALHDPEILIDFLPDKLRDFDLTPVDLVAAVHSYFRDVAAGSVQLGDQEWLVRLVGTSNRPEYLADLPIPAGNGQTPIGAVAEVTLGHEKPSQIVHYNGQPAVLMAVMKKSKANTLDLLDKINGFIAQKNRFAKELGIEVVLLHDQTPRTRRALNIMRTNAIYGLGLVMLVTWLFLGLRISLFIGLGIPFILAGLFWVLHSVGETLNVSVLLGVVIALGMLVDDAVVVVESVYYRWQRGAEALRGVVAGLREVWVPITTSVLTTMAAFLPLMLMSGIMGDFMFVIPFVVTVSLLVSLVEAFWILPVHLLSLPLNFTRPSRSQRLRSRIIHRVRLGYARLLIHVLRYPLLTIAIVVSLFAGSLWALNSKMVRVEFFADDPTRLFFVNVETASGTALQQTMEYVDAIEQQLRAEVQPEETRAIGSYSGVTFTPTGLLVGDKYGQIVVGLQDRQAGMRSVDAIIEDARQAVAMVPGPINVAFQRQTSGPPTLKPISIKVRGNDFTEIRAATDDLRIILEGIEGIKEIADDDSGGKPQLRLTLDSDAAKRSGFEPEVVGRIVRLLVDGEVVASMQNEGEEWDVRVRAKPGPTVDIMHLSDYAVALPGGGSIALGNLVRAETEVSKDNIRHYNFRRAITLEADIDKSVIDTVEANERIQAKWDHIHHRYPGVELDFTGELEDIQESLGSLKFLFVFGISLIYLILGAQFNSYWQPFLILAMVPVAFTGVILGLLITGHPLSLYTLYGVVALAGIAVNSAIVLIVATNTRRAQGMSVLHATVYAARRRVIPVLITSLSTIAGLFSLAVGLGGESLLWGPMASSIVWGLAFSTVLTLFLVPVLYRMFMGRRGKGAARTAPDREVAEAVTEGR